VTDLYRPKGFKRRLLSGCEAPIAGSKRRSGSSALRILDTDGNLGHSEMISGIPSS